MMRQMPQLQERVSLIEIYGNCGECGEEELLNHRGGICWQCWSHLDYLEHESEVRESKPMTSEEE
jgi:predicted amidophosphoribosyltransferase